MNIFSIIATAMLLVIFAVALLIVVTAWAWMQFAAIVDDTSDAIAASNQICEEKTDEI